MIKLTQVVTQNIHELLFTQTYIITKKILHDNTYCLIAFKRNCISINSYKLYFFQILSRGFFAPNEYGTYKTFSRRRTRTNRDNYESFLLEII